jgi:hypothetical protein
MKTACGQNGTVILSDDFEMGPYTCLTAGTASSTSTRSTAQRCQSPQYGGIDFSGKQLVIIGNNQVLDAEISTQGG